MSGAHATSCILVLLRNLFLFPHGEKQWVKLDCKAVTTVLIKLCWDGIRPSSFTTWEHMYGHPSFSKRGWIVQWCINWNLREASYWFITEGRRSELKYAAQRSRILSVLSAMMSHLHSGEERNLRMLVHTPFSDLHKRSSYHFCQHTSGFVAEPSVFHLPEFLLDSSVSCVACIFDGYWLWVFRVYLVETMFSSSTLLLSSPLSSNQSLCLRVEGPKMSKAVTWTTFLKAAQL